MNFALRKLLLTLQKFGPANPLFELLERNLLNKTEPNHPHPPTFIVGPPRTGSTLLYQLLVSNYNFSYLSNFTAFFYKNPAWMTKKTLKIKKTYNPDKFESKYGLTKGLWAPSEAGQLYRYWFEQGGLDEEKQIKIKKTLYYISDIVSAPFLWKNLDLSKKIDTLIDIFPDAVFLYMKREPLYTAQSLLLSRYNKYGRSDKWFGIEPPDIENIRYHPPHEQVTLQVKSIEECIAKAINENDLTSVVKVNYEELCRETKDQLSLIQQFYKESGIEVNRVTENIPELKSSNEKKISDKDWKKLKKYVQKHFE